ncbi:hypothetical protein BASA81_003619 [Batrachochytrium salamandrivorans]|nr:hypothetical protein BASA81_003619 [Batrachochytrium salamandrivorans]
MFQLLGEANLRSVLETSILLFVCCVWTPLVLFPKLPQEAVALASSGFGLTALFYLGKRGELPAKWKEEIVRPTSIDSGLLYGTSLVSMSFAAHMLHEGESDSGTARINFWCSIGNLINFGWLLVFPHHPSPIRVLGSACVVLGFSGRVEYVICALGICELCLQLGMRGLKKSFTLGELLLVVQYFGLCTCDMVFYSIARFPTRNGVDLAVEFGVLGCVWLAAWLIPFFRQSPGQVDPIRFYLASAVFLGGVISPLAFWVLGMNPIWFVRDFTFSTLDHMYLLAYWCLVLAVALPLIHSRVKHLPLVVIRKLYHILALVLFAPAIHFTRSFLGLGFGVATGLALIIEYVRACHVPPLGAWLDKYMRAYTDDRDDGIFILTHLYLLVGCACSVWATQSNEGMAAYGGVLILGAGDAAAAIVGSQFGKHPWLSTGRKTIEGTVSGFLAVLLCSELVFESDLNRTQLVLASLATLVLEAFTTQIDNLVLPIVFTSLLRLF